MSKFKKGDRILRINCPPGSCLPVGEVVTVSCDYSNVNVIQVIEYPRKWFSENYFKLVEEKKLPDWVLIEPEKIIPAKKTFRGIIIDGVDSHRPSLDVLPAVSTSIGEHSRVQLRTSSSQVGYFTKQGLQRWIKALQELESYMD